MHKLRNTIFWAAMALGSTAVNAQQNVSFAEVLAHPSQEPDSTLSYGQSAQQRIDVWLNENAYTDVFFIHGGCWLSQYDVQHARAFASALQQQGHQVFAIEYRRTGATGGGWPQTYDDIRQGFAQWLEQRDSNRPLIVAGHSAGGHLALLLGAESDYRNQIDAVIGLAAITDIREYATGDNSCERVTVDFMGGTAEQLPDAYAAANPSTKQAHPNTLLLQGDNDAIVHYRYAHKLKDAQSNVLPDAGHFDWLHPQTPAFKQLLDILQEHH